MRKSRFSEEQIIKILKEKEAGAKLAELCRRRGAGQRGSACRKSVFRRVNRSP